ncbi:MAG: 4-phosphoerythronate dehydrogenase [Paludibacteraceae bacterium]|nr:4-phosphoerythronate dehydrogenase [Paludibacteraceae bacterium]
MRILIDKYIPFLQGILDRFAEVCFLEPDEFTPAMVHDADALIVRTRTQCFPDLLKGSSVQFIATATIGTDHIDKDYCRAHKIKVVSCPGCNSQAVCDYVEEAIMETLNVSADIRELPSSPFFGQFSLGVVGAGHVGKKVARMAMNRGFHVVINDPPLNLNGNVCGCDIITFHTPLTRKTEYPTYHLCNEKFLSKCRADALIINAARGGVVDEQALLKSGNPFIIDTWENEPNINHKVLDSALLASFHIAGYSRNGKLNASRTCLHELCEHFGLPKLKIRQSTLPEAGDSDYGWIKRISDKLKANPQSFETLRKEYKLR